MRTAQLVCDDIRAFAKECHDGHPYKVWPDHIIISNEDYELLLGTEIDFFDFEVAPGKTVVINSTETQYDIDDESWPLYSYWMPS